MYGKVLVFDELNGIGGILLSQTRIFNLGNELTTSEIRAINQALTILSDLWTDQDTDCYISLEAVPSGKKGAISDCESIFAT